MMRTGLLESRPFCPSCGLLLNLFTPVDHDDDPEAGDVTICTKCKNVLQFNQDMSLKFASAEVIEECGLLEISRAQRQAREFEEMMNLAKKIKETMASEISKTTTA